MIAILLGPHRIFFSPAPVVTYRVTGKYDSVPATEVTVTDLVQLLAMEEATHPRARGATRSAPNQIIRTPNESTAAVANQLTDTSYASVVDCNRPHTTEAMLFWRYVQRTILRISCGALARCWRPMQANV